MAVSGRGSYHYKQDTQEWVFTGPWNEQEETYDLVIRVAAAEYRYDGGRERYLVRPRDPNAGFAVLPGAQWRDYDGEDVYGDYAVDPDTGAVPQGQAYLPGVGFWNAAANEPQYVHGDQVGTARLLTGPAAAVRARTVMTAFGEPMQASGPGIPPVGTRYGYAGSWGYEEAECRVIDLNGPEPGGETTWCDPLAELGWLHVGHRYYDPASGRFVQRDPIGIAGGLNTYAYVRNDPLSGVDPSGLYFGWWLGDEETGNFWVDLTGGRDSWFDDHRKVRHAQKTLLGVAAGCLAGAGGCAILGVNPWLGRIALHAAHAGGPHRFPHLQIMVRTGRHVTKHIRIPLWF